MTGVPITLDARRTFFERVRFKVTWPAERLDRRVRRRRACSAGPRTRPRSTVTVAEPDTRRVLPTHDHRHEPGPDRRPPPRPIVVENDKPTAKAANGRRRDRHARQLPPSRSGSPGRPPRTRPRRSPATSSRSAGTAGRGARRSPSARRAGRPSARWRSAARTTPGSGPDGVGNWSAWVESTESVRAVVVDDRSSAIGYTASWKRTTSIGRRSTTPCVARRARAPWRATRSPVAASRSWSPNGPGSRQARDLHRWRVRRRP